MIHCLIMIKRLVKSRSSACREIFHKVPSRTLPFLLALFTGVSVSQGVENLPLEKSHREWETRNYEENPTGLQIGFWANHTKGGKVLQDFGRRPIDRVAFHKWNFMEITPGVYNFGEREGRDSILAENDATHLNGSTMITNVNISFSNEVNPDGIGAIPKWYPQRITDETTRAAGKKFLRAFVREMLGRYGQIILSIDYEFPWFYYFATPSNRLEFRDWIVEASAVARDEAAQMGRKNDLTLMVIVNVNPYRVNQEWFGTPNAPNHEHLPWLQDIFDTGDMLGLDIYEYLIEDRANPEGALRSAQYWIGTYGRKKPTYFTEIGMSSYLEVNPEFDGGWQTHNYGTYEQQSEFFSRLLTALPKWKSEDPILRNTLKGACLWMYSDGDIGGSLDQNFGIVRRDGQPKPAHAVVKDGINKIEADPQTQPSSLVETVASPAPSAESPVSLTFRSGTSFQTLVWRPAVDTLPPAGEVLKVEIEMEHPGSVIACVSQRHWMGGQTLGLATRHTLEFKSELFDREKPEIELWFTGLKYPFTQKVTRIEFVSEDSKK